MRIRVSLSRSWTLGASSFANVTRVCNAIRSAVELEFGPLQDSIIADFHRSQFKRVVQAKPNARNFAANLASKARIRKTLASLKSLQRLALPVSRFEFRIAVIADFRRRALERLLRRNAVEPALLVKLILQRKPDPHQQADFPVGI